MAEDCLICAKHRGEGPLVGPIIWAGDLLVVSHRPAFPGYLFVETRRHVASLDKLKLNEVAAIAQAAWRAARGLRAELDAESVFSFIAGRAVAHFHQHVFARHKGTPDHIGWMDGHLWPGAPRTTPSGIAELCERLKHHFT